MPAAATHDVFALSHGTTPLLVSVPHDGRSLPAEQERDMTPAGLDLPDTDWHVAELYEFARALGASMIVANYSRYVVDLNRAASDEPLYEGQLATGLFPHKTFAGEDIYRADFTLDEEQQDLRLNRYWRPYHEHLAGALAALRTQHGYALLWDAHSIPSEVPALFDGALPVLNIGTFDQRSCAEEIAAAPIGVARGSSYSTVVNGRFKGGHITRRYGEPGAHIHGIQLEIAQRAYMNERTRALDADAVSKLRATLAPMLESFVDAAARFYA